MGCNPSKSVRVQHAGPGRKATPPIVLDEDEQKALRLGLARSANNEDTFDDASFNSSERKRDPNSSPPRGVLASLDAPLVESLLDGGAHSSGTQARLLRYYMRKKLDEKPTPGTGGERDARKRAHSLAEELETPVAALLADNQRIRDAYGLMTGNLPVLSEEIDPRKRSTHDRNSVHDRNSARMSLPGAPGALRASRTNRFPTWDGGDSSGGSHMSGHGSHLLGHVEGSPEGSQSFCRSKTVIEQVEYRERAALDKTQPSSADSESTNPGAERYSTHEVPA